MKKRLLSCLCFLCCSAMLSAASCRQDSNTKPVTQDSTTTLQPVSTAKTYLALGDSYTIGQSINSSGRYPAQVAGIVDSEGISMPAVQYIATTGWTTLDLQEAISSEHLTGPYDIVTLLIGVNDQYQGVDTATYSTRFAQLLQTSVTLAGNNKQHVIVISIPDYGVTPFGGGNQNISMQINEFNAINKRITDAAGITYVDVTTLSRAAATDHTLLASDGLHYSAKEYRLWANELAPIMYQLLK